MDPGRCSPHAASGKPRSCSGVLDDRSRLAVICSGIWPRRQRSSPMVCRRRSRSAVCALWLERQWRAMTAAEITEGLSRLGILHRPRCRTARIKMPSRRRFGAGRGAAHRHAGGVPDLTLAVSTRRRRPGWSMSINRKVHSEIGESPRHTLPRGPEVTRPCPDSDTLRLAFTRTDSSHAAQERWHRRHRRPPASRFPTAYRHLTRLEVRYAGWDLGIVHLVDERTGKVYVPSLFPQDKTHNATACAVALDPISPEAKDVKPATGIAPLLAG